MLSVSQGYHLLLSTQEASSTTTSLSQRLDWNWFWKLDIPPKYLLFVWRLLHGAIPTTEILQQHHLQVSQHCYLCSASEESLLHVFVFCPFSRAVWFGSSLSLLANTDHTDIISWLTNYLIMFRNSVDPTLSNCHLFIAILYHIWEARNKNLHNNAQTHPLQVINKCHCLLKALHNKKNFIPQNLHLPSARQGSSISIREVSSSNLAVGTALLAYQYKNGSTLYTILLVMHQSLWRCLHIWRNADNWQKTQFLFWCIRDFILKHTHSGLISTTGQALSRIVVEKKGYAALLCNSLTGHYHLAPILHDLHSLIPCSSHKNYGGKLGRNILRQILDYLLHSYFSFPDYVVLSF